jgi:putative two-component system response regulator
VPDVTDQPPASLPSIRQYLLTRIVGIVAFSREKSVGIIREGRGTHFDPDMVDAFLAIKGEFHTIAERFADSEEDVKKKARA